MPVVGLEFVKANTEDTGLQYRLSAWLLLWTRFLVKFLGNGGFSIGNGEGPEATATMLKLELDCRWGALFPGTCNFFFYLLSWLNRQGRAENLWSAITQAGGRIPRVISRPCSLLLWGQGVSVPISQLEVERSLVAVVCLGEDGWEAEGRRKKERFWSWCCGLGFAVSLVYDAQHGTVL